MTNEELDELDELEETHFEMIAMHPLNYAPFGEACDHPFSSLLLRPEGYKCMRCGKVL